MAKTLFLPNKSDSIHRKGTITLNQCNKLGEDRQQKKHFDFILNNLVYYTLGFIII